MSKLSTFGLAMGAMLAIGSISYLLNTPADASTNQNNRNDCNKKNVVGVCANVNANIERNDICVGVIADAREQCEDN